MTYILNEGQYKVFEYGHLLTKPNSWGHPWTRVLNRIITVRGNRKNSFHSSFINKIFVYSRHPLLSDPLRQSLVPSHFKWPWMHLPSQRDIFSGQSGASLGRHLISSDPSVHSEEPLHFERNGTQRWLWQANWPSLQVLASKRKKNIDRMYFNN